MVITTGTGTVSKTGCTLDNLLMIHVYEDQTTFQVTRSNGVNIKFLNGVANGATNYISAVSLGVAQVGNHSLFVGRTMADGTASLDLTVGAGGGDVTARMYEFSRVSQATTNLTMSENVGGSGGGLYQATTATNTTPGDPTVVTSGYNELAVAFLAIQGAQAVDAFTGETGGDWVEAIAEYTHTTGSGATLQLQTSEMLSPGTLNGGTMTITSAPWGVIAQALLPSTQSYYATRRRTVAR